MIASADVSGAIHIKSEEKHKNKSPKMTFCGPKLSLFGLIISVWGIIQLVSCIYDVFVEL